VKAKTRAVANWIWLIAIVISGVAAIAKEQSSSARIDQTAFVPLGGIDQWISIGGESRANPVLLVVHGGPGEAQWPQGEVYRPWEKDFIVVQWDQRGSGYTFGRYGTKTPDVTLDRISKDGVELAEYLCGNLADPAGRKRRPAYFILRDARIKVSRSAAARKTLREAFVQAFQAKEPPEQMSDATSQTRQVLKRFLLIFNDRIFDSMVDRGIPSLTAAPVGPATRPPVSFSAISIMSFSCSRNLPPESNLLFRL